MNTRIIMAIMLVLSMLNGAYGCWGEDEERTNGTIEIVDTIGDVDLDLTVDYEATVKEKEDKTVYKGTHTDEGYYWWWDCEPAEYDIDGTITFNEETEIIDYNYGLCHPFEYEPEIVTLEGEYTTELDAEGRIVIWNEDESVKKVCLWIDGVLYQTTESEFLYKDDSNRYYSYDQVGYEIGGHIYYNEGRNRDHFEYWFYDISDYFMRMYYAIPYVETHVASPALGVGFQGSVVGDLMPTLYSFKNLQGECITSTTFPVEGTYKGPVIVTPPRVAGIPLDMDQTVAGSVDDPLGGNSPFWDTAKGQRTLMWKNNNQ